MDEAKTELASLQSDVLLLAVEAMRNKDKVVVFASVGRTSSINDSAAKDQVRVAKVTSNKEIEIVDGSTIKHSAAAIPLDLSSIKES